MCVPVQTSKLQQKDVQQKNSKRRNNNQKNKVVVWAHNQKARSLDGQETFRMEVIRKPKDRKTKNSMGRPGERGSRKEKLERNCEGQSEVEKDSGQSKNQHVSECASVEDWSDPSINRSKEL